MPTCDCRCGSIVSGGEPCDHSGITARDGKVAKYAHLAVASRPAHEGGGRYGGDKWLLYNAMEKQDYGSVQGEFGASVQADAACV